MKSDFEFSRLENGVRVILVPMSGVKSIGVGVYVGTGSRYETPEINGISHFLEHMVFKGTKKFPTHKETSYLEGLGAIQNAWTDVDATCYWSKIPSDKWKLGLEMVKELALYPTIPARDLEIERGVILEEIRRREDRPDEMSSEVLQELMFAPNPLGMTVLGTEAVIKSLSKDQFMDYHQSQYKSDNIVVALAGDIKNISEVKKSIEEWFESLPKSKSGKFLTVKNSQTEPRLKVERKELANQAHIELGVPAVSVTDPRRFPLSVLTTYLGRGLSSRLFTELREKRGLCYAVRADDQKLVDTGLWSVYAGLNIDKLEDAIEAILGEMSRLKNTKLTDQELAQAKEKIRGPLLFSMENPVNQMDWYAKQALDKPDEVLDYDTVIDRLMQVTVDDVQQVARDLFRSEMLNLAIVGPVDKDREANLLMLCKKL